MASEIELNMSQLQSSIQWSGMVRLHQLRSDDESKLSEAEWPKKSGRIFYACASTGLLFDKQSGRCLQSSNVELLLDTVAETKCTAGQFEKWRKARTTTGQQHLKLKPGPKPKGYKPPREMDGDYDD
jgi:hypothetical protein